MIYKFVLPQVQNGIADLDPDLLLKRAVKMLIIVYY